MTQQNISEVKVKTLGGNLKVYAQRCENGIGFENIWLEGLAEQVFHGTFNAH